MARRAKTDEFHFDGFESPNTTPVPDVVFDRLLAQLGEAELKALLYIIRRTFGFKKDRDPISFNQFLRGIVTHDGRTLDEGCGVRDRTTLSKALKSLEAKGIVMSEKGTDERGENVTTIYRLRFKDKGSAASTVVTPQTVVGNSYHPQGAVGDPYHPGMNHRPPVVGDPYPQQTGLQQTDRQSSNIRMAPPLEKREQRSNGRKSGAEPRPRQRDSTELVASVLQRRRGRPRRVVAQDEDYQVIQTYIADFAREFNDRAPLKASTSRAYNLLKRSGLSRAAFIDQLYAGRAIVKERTASIRSHSEPIPAGLPTKHKMAYYFAVLEDLLGLADERSTPQQPT